MDIEEENEERNNSLANAIVLSPPIGSFKQQAIDATQSVFNIGWSDLDKEGGSSAESTSVYECKLTQEIKDWKKFWFKTLQNLKEAKESHPTIDHSILSAEKRAYLDNAPNLQMFLRESLEFREKSYWFLNDEYFKICSMQKNLLEISAYYKDVAKTNKICKNLANTSVK